MMQLHRAVSQFQTDLTTLTDRLSVLIQTYGKTPMMGRTLLQHALPITFGDKLTGWLDGLTRSVDRLQRLADSGLVLQLGGPVGTGTSFGAQVATIRQRVAQQLDLQPTDHAWHTQRDRLNELTTALGILNGSLGKLANDVILLMQTEVGEVREGAAEGKGGSSSMPHKRNPVSATFMLSIAHQTPGLVSAMLGAMIQPHERAAGAWHSEWPIVRQLARLTGANLHHANELFAGLEVDVDRMKKNMGGG
ncbi:lyase family protein [Spirosoma rhododendri]|uniref:lyase family protein n=1 Tax=Spirosoma rhododendri TaxID=2728024 RepID=UPI0020C2B731|nr:lyase family protein [Spirosoma rhododendri]